jgi:hypothetical protein
MTACNAPERNPSIEIKEQNATLKREIADLKRRVANLRREIAQNRSASEASKTLASKQVTLGAIKEILQSEGYSCTVDDPGGILIATRPDQPDIMVGLTPQRHVRFVILLPNVVGSEADVLYAVNASNRDFAGVRFWRQTDADAIGADFTLPYDAGLRRADVKYAAWLLGEAVAQARIEQLDAVIVSSEPSKTHAGPSQ